MTERPSDPLAELNAARRRRRLADVDWFEAFYQAYLTGLGVSVAAIVASTFVPDRQVAAATAVRIAAEGPALLGLGFATVVAMALRSGGRGGPLALEPPTVVHVLLAPVDRASVLRAPAGRQLRFAAFVGSVAGAVAGLLAARRLPVDAYVAVVWGAVAGAMGALAAVGASLVASGRRWSTGAANAAAVVVSVGADPRPAAGALPRLAPGLAGDRAVPRGAGAAHGGVGGAGRRRPCGGRGPARRASSSWRAWPSTSPPSTPSSRWPRRSTTPTAGLALPVAPGTLLVRHLGAPVAGTATVLGSASVVVPLFAAVGVPVATASAVAAAASSAQGQAEIKPSTMVLPEAAGTALVFRNAWPPALVTLSLAPVLAARHAAGRGLSPAPAAAGGSALCLVATAAAVAWLWRRRPPRR